MRIKTIARFTLILPWVLVVAGCACAATQQAESLITPLPKLTAAIDAIVRYPDPMHPVPDERLVTEAIKDKPELQRTFQGLPIKVRHNAKDVVVLVCSPNGQWAWLEDASWTPEVDHEWYLVTPPMPAVFTMNPAQKETP